MANVKAIMFRNIVLLVSFAAVANGGRSPNADAVENLKKTPLGSRLSNNVYEDALLDVPDLIAKYGYPVEVHTVTTSDNYILTMHRIPHGRDNNNQPGKRPVVFLMHGLISSSADFVVLGPGSAIAYLLAEAGYDVWMGNARGNYYSRHHVQMNPDSRFDNFWDFTWEEIGLYDLPAFFDYILNLTGEDQMHYLGHSQGGTVFLVLNSMKPEYNAKFKSFQGFAPAAYFTNNDHTVFNTLAQYEKLIEGGLMLLTTGEILTNDQALRLVESRICNSAPIDDPLCVSAIMQSSPGLSHMNATMLPLFLSHSPAGASVRQIAHFGQIIKRDVFARFYHNPISNLFLYGRINPPEYDVTKITVPSYLYYGLADSEVDWRDLHILAQKLNNTVTVHQAGRENFNHYDFIWGTDAKTLVYDKAIENIRSIDSNVI